MSHDLKPRGGEGGLFHSHSKERPPADTANKKMLSLKIAGISSQQIREMNSARSAVKVIRKPRHFDGIGAYYGASPPLPPSLRTYFSKLGYNEGFGFKSPNQTERGEERGDSPNPHLNYKLSRSRKQLNLKRSGNCLRYPSPRP